MTRDVPRSRVGITEVPLGTLAALVSSALRDRRGGRHSTLEWKEAPGEKQPDAIGGSIAALSLGRETKLQQLSAPRLRARQHGFGV